MDKIGRLARLGGILGLALGSLAVSVCSGKPGSDPDGQASMDAAALDAGPDGAADPDAGVSPDGEVETPDARLWDVLCE